MFFIGLAILSSFTNASSLSCISMNNQACKARPEIINVNSNNPLFYPFSIKTSKCSGNCNNINDPYAKICVTDVVKDLNVKVFNLMSRTNESRHIKWHEMCRSIFRLDAIVCNNKQCWNNDKCRCECKKLIDKGICDKEYAWNPSNCECECDKSCDFGEYLTLAENENSYKCSSCTVYAVLFWIFFTINVGGIDAYLVYFHWYLKKDVTSVGF